MAERLLDEFASFFDGLSDAVRSELSFFLVALTDEGRADGDWGLNYESAARALFDAQTRVGRIGNLIGAAAIFDVYFSADVAKRFEATGRRPPGANGHTTCAMISTRYADRLKAIEAAHEEWQALRRTTLSPAAIGAALIPPTLPRARYTNRMKPARPADKSL